MTDTQADLTERARPVAVEFFKHWISASSNPSDHINAFAAALVAFAHSECKAAAVEIAKLTAERDDARFHVRDMVATNAAMAAERDRAKNNLEHWRQEVGKLHSKIARLEAAAAEARRAAIEECANLLRRAAEISDPGWQTQQKFKLMIDETCALASPAPQEETR